MELLIAGFLLATIGVTLVDSVVTIITGVTELVKAKINVKITRYNSQMVELSNQEQGETRAIGFMVDSNEEEDYPDAE